MSLFGKHFQSKYMEVIFSLIVAMFASGLVHQVAVTIFYSLLRHYTSSTLLAQKPIRQTFRMKVKL
ncbi:hypothetical protein BLA29_001496 [Euroglyphus maynei]|uniref:Uncharacterized protein n=1 Tax=Euroglyphus maynei TaxID=6958 RepID=A0A1Y3BDM4_EURMA|nr:hypothetical protein BLA29_001496 [Euroglyphus maynei]